MLELAGETASGKSLVLYSAAARLLLETCAKAASTERAESLVHFPRCVALIDSGWFGYRTPPVVLDRTPYHTLRADGSYCPRVFAHVLLRAVRTLGAPASANIDAIVAECLSRLHVYPAAGGSADVQVACLAVADGHPPPLPPLGQRRRRAAAAAVAVAAGTAEGRAVAAALLASACLPPADPACGAKAAAAGRGAPVADTGASAGAPSPSPLLSFALVAVDSLGAHYWSDRSSRTRAAADALQRGVAVALRTALSRHSCAAILTRPLLFGSAETFEDLRRPCCAETRAGVAAAAAYAASVAKGGVPGVAIVASPAWVGTAPVRPGAASSTEPAAAPGSGDSRGSTTGLDASGIVRLMRPYVYAGLLHGGATATAASETPETVTVLLTRLPPADLPFHQPHPRGSGAGANMVAEGTSLITGRAPLHSLILVRRASAWDTLPATVAEGVVLICGSS